MKYQYFPQVKVVSATTGEEFERRMNEALADLAGRGRKFEVTFNLNQGHCAYVQYDECREVPETVAEEYRLRGEIYSCINCPNYKPSMDGRTKYSRCDYMSERTYGTREACEWFYKKVAKGEISPIE